MAEAGEGTEDTTGLTETDTATTARDLLLKVPPSTFLRLCLTRRGLLPRREVAASMVAWFPANFENLETKISIRSILTMLCCDLIIYV